MENKDLKFIKKHYGENFTHFCRNNFSTILEIEGLLSEIISNKFAPTRSLYDSLVRDNKEVEFKNFIYSFVGVQGQKNSAKTKSPEELMNEAGYILYPECQTEEDIQKFKKYYKSGEELCTFRGGRLKHCRVWFAVKKNVDEIKRENFTNPMRQDEYGTSVISIQFTHGNQNILSIKNRYNHTVYNPDATFSNDLENIAAGLTDAFVQKYNLNIKNQESRFFLEDFIEASDGKMYKYNVEINNMYFCENNFIIKQNRDVMILDKSSQILIENFVLDLKNKKLTNFLEGFDFDNSFVKSVGDFNNIEIEKIDGGNRIIKLIPTNDGEKIEIKINKSNQIIGYSNSNITKIGHNFLHMNNEIAELNFPNVEEIGENFLCYNRNLNKLNLPKVRVIGNKFLLNNKELTELNLPKVLKIGYSFLYSNNKLTEINLPKVNIIEFEFLHENENLSQINLPNVKEIGSFFLFENRNINKINFPKVTKIGNEFMSGNLSLKNLILPNVTTIGSYGLSNNSVLEKISLPKIEYIAKHCFGVFCEEYHTNAQEKLKKMVEIYNKQNCANLKIVNNKNNEIIEENLTF